VADLDLTESLGHEEGDAVTDNVLKVGNIGNQIGNHVVVEIGPEAGVLSTLELTVEGSELGDSFAEVASDSSGGVDEVESERELCGGELGHCLDQDVGDHLILDTVGVELIS